MTEIYDHTEKFADLLQSLTCTDNTTRNSAEITYSSLKSISTESVILQLSNIVSSSNIQDHIKCLALVLFRKELFEKDVYLSISTSSKEQIKERLISRLIDESNLSFKNKLCEFTSDLYRNYMEVAEWPELLQFTAESIVSSDVSIKEIALGIIGVLPEQAMFSLFSGNNILVFLDTLKNGLLDLSFEGRLTLQTLRALNSMFDNISKESDLDHFHVLIPYIFKGLENSIVCVYNGSIKSPSDYPTFGNISLDLAYSQLLVEIVENAPNFFASQLENYFESFVNILKLNFLRKEIKYLLLEFLVVLCELSPKYVRKYKPTNQIKKSTFQKRGYFLESIFPIVLEMFYSLEDTSLNAWAESEFMGGGGGGCLTDEKFSDFEVADSSISRILMSLGLLSTYQIMTNQLTNLFAEPNTWIKPYIGFRLIASYFPVTLKITDQNQLDNHLKSTIYLLTKYSSDPRPDQDQRVLYSCFAALGQLVEHHSSSLDDNQMNNMLSLTLQSIKSSANYLPCVTEQLIFTLSSVIEYSSQSFLETNIACILECIIISLNMGPLVVQKACILALISLSSCIKGPNIAMYYDAIMPVLRNLLNTAAVNSNSDVLFGQILECCAMLGESCGKEKFNGDAIAMMHSLQQLDSELREDAQSRPYLIKAWVRIARCLEAEFAPFLPIVMNNLFASISQDIVIKEEAEDEDEVDGDEMENDNDGDIEYIETHDGSMIAVRTSLVEEQSKSLSLIILLAEKLQELFYPYIQPVYSVITRLIYSYHEDIRSYSVACLPELIRVAGKAELNSNDLILISNQAIELLLNALMREDSMDIIITILQSINSTLIYTSTNWSLKDAHSVSENFKQYLTGEQIAKLLSDLRLVLNESIQRRAVLKAEGQVSGDFNDEDEEDQGEQLVENLEIYFNIGELLTSLMQTQKENTIAPFESVFYELVCSMSHPYCLMEDRSFAYNVLSDFIRFSIPSQDKADKVYPTVLPILIVAISTLNLDIEIRSNCILAITTAVNISPSCFINFVDPTLEALSTCKTNEFDPGNPQTELMSLANSATEIFFRTFKS